ncbi:MAG: hypothetical protein ABFR33_08955 [Verrucomicrobiota bacterium]
MSQLKPSLPEASLGRFAASAPAGFSYRPILVWAINDAMDPAATAKQLASFKASGYGGAMIMPWGQMPYAFMSDEWLDRVGEALAEARQQGLDVWIWDDWLYGSGPADGVLTNDPQYRAKTIKVALDVRVESGETIEAILPPRTVAAGCFPIDKFGNPTGLIQRIDARPGEHVSVPAAGRQRLVAVAWHYISGMQHTTRSHGPKPGEGLSDAECSISISDDPDVWSVDMLNPAAGIRYTELIHERYYSRFPEYFGNTIKGFFYDEPKASTLTPWTDGFADTFRARKGYDILDELVAVMTEYRMEDVCFNDWLRPEATRQADADYREVWTSLVAESFYGTIQSWCQAHGVIATGHPVGDGHPNGDYWLQDLFSSGGDYAKNMAFSDMPGADVVFGSIHIDQFSDAVRMAASRAATKGKARSMTESFAVFGHGLDVDQMRWVMENQLVRGVNTFFNKLSNYNRESFLHFHPPELSDFNPQIAHFGPLLHGRIERMARCANAGQRLPAVAVYAPGGNARRHELKPLAALEELARILTYARVEYDYLFDDDLPDLKPISGGFQTLGGATYATLVVPENACMDDTVSSVIKRLEADMPGAVYTCPADPEDDSRQRIADEIVTAYWKSNPLLGMAAGADGISGRMRFDEAGHQVWLLLNETSRNQTLEIKPHQPCTVLDIDPDTGEATLRVSCKEGETAAIPFASAQSRLLLIDPVGDLSSSIPSFPGKPTSCVRPAEWQVILPDGEVRGLNGDELPNWAELGLRGFSGSLRYRAHFDLDQKAETALLSLGEVCHGAHVYLDGEHVGDCAFAPFTLELGALAAGEHLLEIDVVNTLANQVFGDPDRLAGQVAAGGFRGTYEPIYGPRDRKKLRSGLFGPVEIHI